MKIFPLLIAIVFSQLITAQNKEYRIKNSNVNSKQDNFGVAFCSDDFVIYTRRNTDSKRRLDTDFYLGHLNKDGKIENSKKLSKEVNSKYSEIDLVFTKDFKTVFFTRRTNFRRNKPHFELYKADVVTSGYWINIQPLWFNNDNYSVAHPALSPDGKMLYFASNNPDGYGGWDLYKSIIYDDGKLGKPKNLGKRFNSVVDDTTPFMDQENRLYYASNGRAGYGGLDIYEVNLNDKSNPVNVGKPINSEKNDYAYAEKYDGNYGHFVSNRNYDKEGSDLYYFEITNEKKPEKQVKVIPFSEEDRRNIYSKKSKRNTLDKKEIAKQRKAILGY